MNITTSRPVMGTERVTGGSASFSDANATAQGARAAASIAHGSIAAGRRATSAKRVADLTKLESKVRQGDYSPDAEQIAREIVADARMNVGLRSLVSH